MYQPALKKWQQSELDIEEQEDDVIFDVPHVLNKTRETLLFLHQSKEQLYLLKRYFLAIL